jgi:zinc protease
VFVSLVFLLAACGGGATTPTSRGEALSDIPAMRSITDGVERFELENGLTLLVRPVEGAEATAIVTRVKTGYFHEPDELTGISHVVEHMFFNGTSSRPGTEDISRETKSLGGVLNAATAYDHTTYYAVLPTANWRAGMEIQADALQDPLFDAAVLEKEMGAIKQEARRKLDNPGAYGRESMFALAHEKHRIRRWRIGTEDVLDTLDRDALVRWFEDHYRPSNIILSVVGDVDPAEVRAVVGELYGSMPRGHFRQSGGPAEPAQAELRFRRMNGQLKRAYLFVGFPGPGVGHRDNAALDVLATVLGTGRSSRLSVRLRDELGAVTGVGASSWQYEDVGMFEIQATCDPLNLEMSTRELFIELERLQHFGPTPEEMKRARRILLSSQAFDLEEVLGQANTLAAYEADGHYADYDEELQELLSVTAEDVSRVLDRYIQIDQASILEYVPRGFDASPSAPEMRDHLDAILVAAARDFHAPSFPDRATGIQSITVREEWSAALADVEAVPFEVSRFELPGGGALVVEENPVAPTTSVGVWFRGGRIAEQPNLVGITQVLQRVMMRETFNRSRDQLSRELESLGSGIGPSISDDWFGFRVSGLASDLPHQLDVLFDVVLHPTISEEAFVDELRLRKPAVEGVEDRSAAYTMDLVRGLMFGEHPYGYPAEGSMTGLIALNRDLVEEFYFDQVRPETMVVVVSGDVEAQLVHQMVSAYVEPWDYRGIPVPTMAEEFFTFDRFGDPAREPSNPVRLAERLRSQSTMVASWPTVPRTHPDRAALTVLSEITGGLGGTFFEEIRTRRGLAYQVSTFNQSRMLAGEFSVFVACTPDSLETVKDLVTSLTRSLAADPPSQEQLDRAKAALTGGWKIGGQTNGSRVGRLATFELSGQSPEQMKAWPEQIQAVSVEDLRRVAETWLDRPPLATGILAGSPGSDANPDR